MQILARETVVLGAHTGNQADAIRQAGTILVKTGYVSPSYVDGMIAREQVMSTYLGSGIAIPHGEMADLRLVYSTGVSVLQLPEGVEWESGEPAYLVIGLASIDLKHVEVLANLVELLKEPETIAQLIQTTDPMVIIERLTRRRREAEWK